MYRVIIEKRPFCDDFLSIHIQKSKWRTQSWLKQNSLSKMGDLEDLMFKQNVPGRYSSWLEEQDDRRRETCCHDDVEGEAQASEEYDNYDPNHQEFA